MTRWFLLIVSIFSLLSSAEVNLSIDNFTDDGDGNVTFDIMMTNTVPIKGFQMVLISGNGQYDGDNDCRCDQGDSELPVGCDECYYDYGVDKVRNNREADTNTSSSYIFGCEDGGICTEPDLSSGECEDEGECSDLGDCPNYLTQEDCPTSSTGGVCSWDDVSGCYLGESSCLAAGTCDGDNEQNNNECACAWQETIASPTTWTSADNIWTSNDSYIPYNTIEECFAVTSSDGDPLIWDYFNPDGNNDNFVIADEQRCYVPEFGVDSHADGEIAGHCSRFEPICVAVPGAFTGAGTDYPIGTVLDWPISCCNVTQGGQVFYPFRNKDLCEGTATVSGETIDSDGDWTWMSYEDQATCEGYGGFWYGSEGGTEGNEEYDVGEYFLDSDAILNLTTASGGVAGEANLMLIASQSSIVGINTMGGTIASSETPQALFSVTGTYPLDQVSNVVELYSNHFCGTGSLNNFTGTNCPIRVEFLDGNDEPYYPEFTPLLWTVGEVTEAGGGMVDPDDSICSSIGGWGETIAEDSSCSSLCGDGFCDELTEDYSSCSFDCESSCGDGYCSLYEDGETSENCSQDCSVFGCGDFICSEDETSSNCSYDCFDSYCGDGLCDENGSENALNCFNDCTPICGNLLCEPGEQFINCLDDCESECGDGVYHHVGFEGNPGTEDETCVDYEITCGDGVYHYIGQVFNEITATTSDAEDEVCIADYTQICGDGYYDYAAGENVDGDDVGLVPDCEDYEVTSGDGYCDATSDSYTDETCESECDAENPGTDDACPTVCGDNFYHHSGLGGDETGDGSSDDFCEVDYSAVCNDGYCDESNNETYGTCPADCPAPVCGDGECEVPYENFLGCDADCDSFCGDGVYHHINFEGDPGTEDDACVADYGVTCGDGVYDWNGGENADGVDADAEPDCDYIQTCGDGYYDYLAGELLECFINADEGSLDYVLTCGDGYCDYLLSEDLEVLGDESSNEVYCEVDCVVPGCTDSSACNYNQTATTDDGSCLYACATPGGCAGLDDNYDCDGEFLSVALDFPIVFSLSDNYPNPFNPITTIEYSVEKAGNVNISIYNILGHKVFDLVGGYHYPGIRYSLEWDSNTQSNIPVSTGIYFYEMRSGNYVERKKMVLVK